MNTKFIYNKVKSIVKKHFITKKEKIAMQDNSSIYSHEEECNENALNEAIEAALSQLIAISPAAAQQEVLRLRLAAVDRFHEVSVYSGCQVAGPQA